MLARRYLLVSVITFLVAYTGRAAAQEPAPQTVASAVAAAPNTSGAPTSDSAPTMVARKLGDPPPAGGYFPPSITFCDVNAAADVSANAADHTLPSFQFPLANLPIYIVQNGIGGHGQIRVISFNGSTIMAKTALPSGPQTTIGNYPGKSFRYRAELCVSGAWVPITAPVSTGQASYNGDAEFWTETYGSELVHPTANNILFSFSLRWHPHYFPALHIEAKHKCEGLSGVASVATNYATASVQFPAGYQDPQNLVTRIGVTLHYDPSAVASGPGFDSFNGLGEQIAIGTPPSNPFNDFLAKVFPGLPTPGAVGPSGETGGSSGFPYGDSIKQTLTSASSVEVSDQIRAVLIGVCNGFTATGTVVFADGRAIFARVHSK